jgi:glucose/mannose-6-phosphate isomerase
VIHDLRGSSLFESAWALPQQLTRALEVCDQLPDLPTSTSVDHIVVLGMGAARIAGHALRAVAESSATIPILVKSAHQPPNYFGPRSLVFAVSGSGNTDEVNHAAAGAAQVGAQLIVITSHGWLVELAAGLALPLVRIPADIRPARVAFGMITAALIAVLAEIGVLPNGRHAIERAADHLSRRRDVLSLPNGIAVELAAEMAGRHVTIQGDTSIGAVAARRWKAQINQNARQPASCSMHPDVNHNEAVAWDAALAGKWANEAVVQLRHRCEDPRVSAGMDLSAGYLAGKVPVHTVRGEGDEPLTALLDLVMIGDFMSLYLAEHNQVDPEPTLFISTAAKEGMILPNFPELRTT